MLLREGKRNVVPCRSRLSLLFLQRSLRSGVQLLLEQAAWTFEVIVIEPVRFFALSQKNRPFQGICEVALWVMDATRLRCAGLLRLPFLGRGRIRTDRGAVEVVSHLVEVGLLECVRPVSVFRRRLHLLTIYI